MTLEIAFVFGLVVVALALFAWERVSYDVTALIVLSALLVSGILTPAEGLSGLSNPATVTIGCMFVLSEGLRRTGALDRVGDIFRALGRRHHHFALAAMMAVVGLLSGFINNTAAIALFIPVVLAVSVDLGVSPSKLLMPVSFASMFGGVCTLIGTSTNLLVSAIAEDRGLEPFGIFELAPVGLILAATGLAFLWLVGLRLIPARRSPDDVETASTTAEYVTAVTLREGSRIVGTRPGDIERIGELDVVEAFDAAREPTGDRKLEPGSVLVVRGAAEEIERLMEREDLALWHGGQADFPESERVLVEAIVAPSSGLEGREVHEVDFPERYGAILFAIRHHGDTRRERLSEVRLRGGDTLLLSVPRDHRTFLKRDPSVVVASEIDSRGRRPEKLPIATAILAGVVLFAAFGLAPIVVTALAGTVLLVLSGVLTPEDAYDAVSWKIIFLLAGVIPLGVALDRTGGSDLISDFLTDTLGRHGPRVVLSGLFFVTMMLTNVISNQATAALLAPIAIQAAASLDVDPRPFLLAITYAASLSFMTPVGYQTNTLVYGPGRYRFLDYTRVGTPLNLLLWIVATIAIPWIWPF